MTDLHPRVIRWLQQHYPKPTLDPDWLNDCLDWLINQQHYSLDTDPNAFYAALESQLLQSNLQDSMLHGTGLPIHIALPTTTTVLTGPPILVEISAMTEIAHSAFNLDQIRAAREERSRSGRDMSNNIDEDGDIDVDEGPPPKYPRGMLRFTLTDGATSLPAIEYKPIPQLVLGVTPLGYKMLLKNIKIRNGTAWLQPDCIVLKGFQTEDRQVNQDIDFVRGLRNRMGLPLDVPQITPAPVTASVNMRSPLREISPPPLPGPSRNDDEMLGDLKRRVPSTSSTLLDSQAMAPPIEKRQIASSSRMTSVALQGNTVSPYFLPLTTTNGKDRGKIPLFDLSGTSDDDVDQHNMTTLLLSASKNTSSTIGGTEKSNVFVHSTQNGYEQIEDDPLSVIEEVQLHNPSNKLTFRRKEESLDITEEDEFEGNFLINQAFLDSIDRMEMEAMQSINVRDGISHGPPSSNSASGSTPSVQDACSTTFEDVIEIPDDDENEDKENIPVATRHVRRRTMLGNMPLQQGAPTLVTSGDIINLSDSD